MSHHRLPAADASSPSTHDKTTHAKLMGARHSAYGGRAMLRRRATLAMPAFVDLFTSHLRDLKSRAVGCVGKSAGASNAGGTSPSQSPLRQRVERPSLKPV